MSAAIAMPGEASGAPERLAAQSASTSVSQFVTFKARDRRFGIDVLQVREIRSWVPTTEIPDQAHAACGVLDIRGEIIQVFDFAKLLGEGVTSATSSHVVLVLSLEERTFGILVDAVTDIATVESENLLPSPNGDGLVSSIMRKDGEITTILDLSRIAMR